MCQWKRIICCTIAAWSGGILGGFLGSYGSWQTRLAQCPDYLPFLVQKLPAIQTLSRNLCGALNAPGALWKGSTTGLGTGLVLGAFVGGLATRSKEQKE